MSHLKEEYLALAHALAPTLTDSTKHMPSKNTSVVPKGILCEWINAMKSMEKGELFIDTKVETLVKRVFTMATYLDQKPKQLTMFVIKDQSR